MQYDVPTPQAYFAALEDDWRQAKLRQLRAIIQDKGPELIEGIEYKMLCYGNAKGTLFHLNAQKNYVSLYVGDTQKVDPQDVLLQGLDIGKGCIRFKKSQVVADTQIDQFIERAVQLWRDGADLDC